MATPWVPDREDSQARLCPRTKAYQLRMLVLSPWPRHPSLLVHEAKTGYMRLPGVGPVLHGFPGRSGAFRGTRLRDLHC
jgi:hypothetical protein